MREVVLDTETTGISTKDGHRIVEIGCIELDNLIPTLNKFHSYLNPEKKVSEAAFKVHGYSDSFLSNKPKFHEIADDFLDFIKDKKLIIHNAEFDLSHINNELKIVGKKQLNNEVVDTLTLARDKFPGSQTSLDALCKRFKIDNSRRQKHSALLDCELLAKVYIELLEKKEPTFQFDMQVDEDEITNVKNIKDRKQIIVEVTEDEKKAYFEFLKKNVPKSSLLN